MNITKIKKDLETQSECWINQETGEVRQFAVIVKESTDSGFHKIWLEDLSKILGILGGGKVKVFKYILDNINPYSNEFGGTHREIAEKCEVNKMTVNETITLLLESDFLKKVRVGTYLVNSKTLIQGTSKKRMGIMVRYKELE
jgi:hypothetical protein